MDASTQPLPRSPGCSSSCSRPRSRLRPLCRPPLASAHIHRASAPFWCHPARLPRHRPPPLRARAKRLQVPLGAPTRARGAPYVRAARPLGLATAPRATPAAVRSPAAASLVCLLPRPSPTLAGASHRTPAGALPLGGPLQPPPSVLSNVAATARRHPRRFRQPPHEPRSTIDTRHRARAVGTVAGPHSGRSPLNGRRRRILPSPPLATDEASLAMR